MSATLNHETCLWSLLSSFIASILWFGDTALTVAVLDVVDDANAVDVSEDGADGADGADGPDGADGVGSADGVGGDDAVDGR
jgi:hypothetical protein